MKRFQMPFYLFLKNVVSAPVWHVSLSHYFSCYYYIDSHYFWIGMAQRPDLKISLYYLRIFPFICTMTLNHSAEILSQHSYLNRTEATAFQLAFKIHWIYVTLLSNKYHDLVIHHLGKPFSWGFSQRKTLAETTC